MSHKAEAKLDPEDDELFDHQASSEQSDSEDEPLADQPSTYKARTTRPKPRSTRVLQLGVVLKAPRASQYSAKTFHEMITDGLVDLEPEYQRGVVWPDHKQSAMIESIMQHYYVPPVILSVQDNRETGETTYICIDGKQRLSSVQRFMENQIPVKEPSTGRKFWFKEDLVNAKTPALTPAQKRKFENEQITCVEFNDLTDEIERDIFSRVQMGVTLSSAEKLAAHLGQWPDFIRQLVKRYLDQIPGLAQDHDHKTIILVNRGKDYLFMAQIALLIYHAHVERYIPTPGTIDKFLQQEQANDPDEAFKSEIHLALSKYVALANHKSWGKCIKPVKRTLANGTTIPKPLAPVEFVYVGFMIWKFRNATLSQLFQLVQGLKKEVRPQFTDVFFNTAVAGFIRRYIDKAKLPAPLEGDDGAMMFSPAPPLKNKSSSSSLAPRKRSRPSSVSTTAAAIQHASENGPPTNRRKTNNSNGGRHNDRLSPEPAAGLFLDDSQTSIHNPLSNMSLDQPKPYSASSSITTHQSPSFYGAAPIFISQRARP